MTLAPDRSMIEEHLAWLAEPPPPEQALILETPLDDHRIEIAWGSPEGGPRNARTFALKDIGAAIDEAVRANLASNNVYVGMTLKRADTPAVGRTSNGHAALATCMAFDFDHDFRASAELLGSIAKPQLVVITGTRPATRGQLWLRVELSSDLDLWDLFVRDSARLCGADVNAVGINRLMRLAGTTSFPSPAKRSRGYEAEFTRLFRATRESHHAMSIWWDLPRPPNAAQCSAKLPYPQQDKELPLNVINAGNICSALAALPCPFAEEYHLWRNVGFALHDFDPGMVGLALWKTFSARCPRKAGLTDFNALWSRFGRADGASKVTIASVIHHAQQAGWRPPSPWDRLTRIS